MANYYATTDVVCVEIIKGETSYYVQTANDVTGEPVITEGESQTLIVKRKKLAEKTIGDMVDGTDLAMTDTVFNPSMLADLQGGTYTEDVENQVFVYEAPAIGEVKRTSTFDMKIYTEVVDADGPTGEYIVDTFEKCFSSLIAPSHKDGEYRVSEFTIKSRPSVGRPMYTSELVKALPVGVQKFVDERSIGATENIDNNKKVSKLDKKK